LCFTSAARAEGWGKIKGQVVWDEKVIPENEKAKVDKDQAVCLKNGDIYTNKFVIDPKSKGVRWVLVWLADPKAGVNNKEFEPAIHPSLKKPKTDTVVIDQPCCVFEPRVMGMRVGQSLVVKNPAPIQHNFAINSFGNGPTTNPLIPPGGQTPPIKGFVGTKLPTQYSCSIHGWMKGYIGVFNHPYFAVTDKDGTFEIKNAPAGTFRLAVWHETGWVIQNPKNFKDIGKVVEVKAGGTTNVGKIPMKKPADE